MTNVLSGELLKLRTTRTFYGLVIGCLALVAIIVVGGSVAGSFEPDSEPGRDLLPVASLAQTFALVLGILAVSTEFRHGTITPTLLGVPSRSRLMAAKLIAYVLASLALGLVAYALSAALIAVILPIRGIESGLGFDDIVDVGLGGIVVTVLYGALGVGFGAIVRNQVGAVVGALGWVFVLEPLVGIIPGVTDIVQKYGLNGLAGGVSGTAFGGSGGGLLDPVPAGLLLLLYVAVLAVAGTALLRRRDISA